MRNRLHLPRNQFSPPSGRSPSNNPTVPSPYRSSSNGIGTLWDTSVSDATAMFGITVGVGVLLRSIAGILGKIYVELGRPCGGCQSYPVFGKGNEA